MPTWSLRAASVRYEMPCPSRKAYRDSCERRGETQRETGRDAEGDRERRSGRQGAIDA